MRVLHVSSGHMLGGVETMLMTVAAHSAAAGMAPSFAFAFDGPIVPALRESGHSVWTFGGARFSRPLSMLRARAALRAAMRAESPDVVVCHGSWSLALFAGVVRGAGHPLVLWVHDVVSSGSLPVVDRLARRVRPDLVINNSAYTAAASRRLFPRAPMRVVHCPVTPPAASSDDARARLRAEHGVTPGTRVIVQIGRWEPSKGQLVLLEALASLRDRSDWTCWQVGAPQQRHEHAHDAAMRARAEALGIGDRVRFLGWQREVSSVLAAADIYCQPSLRPEAFGITFVEAMYAGLPVIGPALGGPQEIITPAVGATAEPGNVPSLAAAIRRYLDDPRAIEEAAAAGPARARLLSDPAARMRELASALSAVSGRSDMAARGVRPVHAPALTPP